MNQKRNRWRRIDTGLRSAAENIALNRAILEAHQAGEIPHTLRFLRFQPAALIGFHQSVAQELRADYCRENGIEIQRRITGGGAIYFDQGQLGWELYLNREAVRGLDMEQIAAHICEAAAAGMRRLGVDARFRPRNDIEVGGRKISGTGGVFEGNSFLYQGTLLLDFDVKRMLRVLRIPAEKLSGKAIASARERVVDVRELLGHVPPLDRVQDEIAQAFAEAFAIEFETTMLSAPEQLRYEQALAEIDSGDWVNSVDTPASDAPLLEGLYRVPGGLLRACVALDRPRSLIKQLWITGDFFVNPKRTIADLESALKDAPIAEVRARVAAFFRQRPSLEMLRLAPEDFVSVIEQALQAGLH